uniref:Uncharacterized protein n=1 Tax=Schlesneria paludicola TaxID=360056 RepID=A0A7C2P8B3_9PLAN
MKCFNLTSPQLWPGTAAVLLSGTLVLTGCGDAPNSGGNGSSSTSSAVSEAGHDDHAHPTEGPHHGDLVELGNEEYHAEIVHGGSGEVTIYVLDSGATKAVPIEATEVTINLSHEGEAEQFKLPAAPDAGDPDGKSSRFTLKDEHLAEDLDAEGAVAKLVITINGKQYTAKIEHDHGHEGHDHAH